MSSDQTLGHFCSIKIFYESVAYLTMLSADHSNTASNDYTMIMSRERCARKWL
jgi:hypothetical protein